MKTFKFLCLCGLAFVMASCGGNSAKTQETETGADDEAFQAEQPVESGMYDATYFDIKGKDSRKGQFDGRAIFALSPEQSAIFVYENGNRTKIKHLIVLDKQFQKQDSVWAAIDKTGLPVTVGKDSTDMYVDYIFSGDTVSITFNPKARSVYTAIEAMQKITEEAKK